MSPWLLGSCAQLAQVAVEAGHCRDPGVIRWLINYILQNSLSCIFPLREGHTKYFCGRLNRRKDNSSSLVFYTRRVGVATCIVPAHCSLSPGLLSWCGQKPVHKFPSSPATSFSLSVSWSGFGFSSLMNCASFSYRAPTVSGLAIVRTTGSNPNSWVPDQACGFQLILVPLQFICILPS